MPATDTSLADDLSAMRELACEAGELARQMRSQAAPDAWEKAPGHLVTEADLAVNRLLADGLARLRPDYGWLSEETIDSPHNRRQERVWVVDPIDGTNAYIRGDPHWCVGLAIVEAGEVVAGVIHAPEFNHLYEARRGGGAFLNGQQIFTSGHSRIPGCRMIASEAMILHDGWDDPWPDIELARPKPNATLLRMALVASGQWDAAVTLWRKSDWDLAAGAILVEEAGGVAATHLGETFRFNRVIPAQRSLIASGKRLFPLLRRRTEVVRLPDPNGKTVAVRSSHIVETGNMGETPQATKQLLHLVIGGELKNVTEVEFEDLKQIDFVGAFPNYKEAYDAWKSAAQRTVDNAEMRYFILHAHKLLDPETGSQHHV